MLRRGVQEAMKTLGKISEDGRIHRKVDIWIKTKTIKNIKFKNENKEK